MLYALILVTAATGRWQIRLLQRLILYIDGTGLQIAVNLIIYWHTVGAEGAYLVSIISVVWKTVVAASRC